jgi:hypothetical protein
MAAALWRLGGGWGGGAYSEYPASTNAGRQLVLRHPQCIHKAVRVLRLQRSKAWATTDQVTFHSRFRNKYRQFVTVLFLQLIIQLCCLAVVPWCTSVTRCIRAEHFGPISTGSREMWPLTGPFFITQKIHEWISGSDGMMLTRENRRTRIKPNALPIFAM